MANWLYTANTSEEQLNLIDVEKIASTSPSSNNQEKANLNRSNIGLLLEDPKTFATTLLTVCLIMYGDETFKVDSLVLFQWLKEDFGIELCEENESKLSAIIVALTTNFFYTDLDVFKSICKTLTSGDPGLDDYDNPTIPEVLWAIYEVSLVSEDTTIDIDEFSPAVELFINALFIEDVDDTSSVDSSEETNILNPENIISENVKELKEQLMFIGIKNIPQFPAFEIET